MISDINDGEYDENSVFNRVLAKKPRPLDTNSATRLERIFATAKAPAHETMNEPINVADFLPVY